MGWNYCRLGAGVLTLALLASVSAAAAQAVRRPLVLVVHSSGSGTDVRLDTQRAIEKAIADELAGPARFWPIYLDLTGPPREADRQTLVPFLAQRLSDQKIELVVVQQYEALSFLLDHRRALVPSVPIVFVQVYSDELTELKLDANVTGVVTARPLGTVPLALGLLPETSRVVLVAGGAPRDSRYCAALEQELRTNWPAIEVQRLDGKPLDEQLAQVAHLPPRSLILFAGYRADAFGRSVVASEVLDELSRAANAPVFGFHENLLGAGLVGGDLLANDATTRQCARLAARALKGEPIGSEPPAQIQATVQAFDARQLARWNISERRLPAGSAVRFRERTLWTDHKQYVIGGTIVVLVQALLIAGLVLERRLRRRTQAELADAEHRYRTVADFATDWVYWTAADGSLQYISPSCESLTGYDAAAFAARPGLLTEIVVEEDREAWRLHRQAPGGLRSRDATEFRIRTRDGRIRWIGHVCSAVVGPDGSNLGRRVSNRDITQRKEMEENLRRTMQEVVDLRDRLEMDNRYMREQLEAEADLEGIHGASNAMRYVASRVQQVAPTGSTVLLLGETGVGKTVLAQAIHSLSPRRARPLVTLNCAALPPALVESELFGHEKGAFTGAQAMRRGRFEIADGGTLFLDEVAELPLDLQAKLLRAVQDGEFVRVGSSVTRKTDVRLIAATNRRLEEEVKAGRFRQDLLYRLNVFPITVPPLRLRPDDIPLLVGHFLEKHCRRLGVPIPPVSKATMKALQARSWPGNIRELENVVERAVITSRGARFDIGEDHLEAGGSGEAQVAAAGARTLADLERVHILATLERLNWRIEGPGGVAEVLGTNASTLRSRMRKHGIRRPGSAPRAPVTS